MEALALRSKKEVKGRRDSERENILQKKGGINASLNDFFAKEDRRKTDYSLDISRWRYSHH